MGRVSGKICLVTGGATGLGAGICQLLANEGARVILTDVRTDEGRELADSLQGEFLQHDVTDEARWSVVVRHVEEKYGALHVLVNNAGIIGNVDRADAENAQLRDWQAIHRVNVEGVFLGCRAAIPAMRRAGGGSIVNMSSDAALMPTAEHVAYGSSKAAVRHITKSVAMHCAKTGSRIRCNSVHPGMILTSMLRRAIEGKAQADGISVEQSTDYFRSLIPLGEFQEPVDIALGVLYLASDESRYVTGTKLCIDGGDTMDG